MVIDLSFGFFVELWSCGVAELWSCGFDKLISKAIGMISWVETAQGGSTIAAIFARVLPRPYREPRTMMASDTTKH
jgi:hypothetical protein